jgi:mono/diheme cytochrome c family protein
MVDALMYRAYEWKMASTPEGAVSQNHYRGFADTSGKPGGVVVGLDREKIIASENDRISATQAASKKKFSDQDFLAKGDRMMTVYCQPCHGENGLGNGPVGRGFAAIPNLVGDNPPGKAATLTDEELYLTIRNGRNRMPAYGISMDDDEIWALVSYIRTLPNGQKK